MNDSFKKMSLHNEWPTIFTINVIDCFNFLSEKDFYDVTSFSRIPFFQFVYFQSNQF